MAHKNKNRATNGYRNKVTDGTTDVEDSPRKPVDILQHIADISQVTGPKHFTKFVPLSGPSRAEQEKMNQKNLPRPRNVRNLKLVESDSEDEEPGNKGQKEEPFNENAIRAGIRSMYGGRNWNSNRYLEERWTKVPLENCNSMQFKKKQTNGGQPMMDFKEGEEEAKARRDAFSRNVGMRGWRSKQQNDTSKYSAVNSNQGTENVGENSCRFPFDQDSVDPDFASRQFCRFDNEDDFLVEHVGKITSVTPRQYLLHNVKDSDFVFSRNNK